MITDRTGKIKKYILFTVIAAAYFLLSSFVMQFPSYRVANAATDESLNGPDLIDLTYDVNKDGIKSATLRFKTVEAGQYIVLKKNRKGDYDVISEPLSGDKDGILSFSDWDVKDGDTYSAAEIVEKKGRVYESKYDSEGITLFSEKPKDLKVDFTNLNSKLSWKKVEGTSGYEIYRKFGKSGDYEQIAGTDEYIKDDGDGGLSYTDIYGHTMSPKEKQTELVLGTFVDLSTLDLCYGIRVYRETNGKRSYGDIDNDGYFELPKPVVVSTETEGKEVKITWSTSKNADRYRIFSGHKEGDSIKWDSEEDVMSTGSEVTMSASIPKKSGEDVYSVAAISDRNGKEIMSDRELKYTTKFKNHEDTKVLFLGDSLTYGSPYRDPATRHKFSYPHRMNQLLGIEYDNPSAAGATLANSWHSKVDYNSYKYSDYDVVVLWAGTNDYTDNIGIGDWNSTSINEFNGAINIVMGAIEDANKARAKKNKKPIKIVYLEMLYSERFGRVFSDRIDRFKQPNSIGLTLSDYQEDFDLMMETYRSRGVDIYRFDTSKYVTKKNCMYVTSDNLHLNRNTYADIGSDLSEFFEEVVLTD